MKNFLIILVDQMSLDCISAYREYYKDNEWLAHWVNTPNLDRLVNEGASFLNSNTPNPVCCPARASLFTGRMPVEHGVYFNNIGIDKNIPNMAQWFMENTQYKSYYCGKWHAGGEWNCPNLEGDRKIPGFETIPLGEHHTGDYLDFKVSEAVSAFLRNYNEKNPFLLVAGLLNPHDICFWAMEQNIITNSEDYFGLEENLPPLPPNMYYNFKADEPGLEKNKNAEIRSFGEQGYRTYIYEYLRMIEKIDCDIQRIIEAVEERNDDTLVVFASDHGDGLARHGRVAKWHPYEESNKVPLIFWDNSKEVKSKVDTTHLTGLIDIFPTICDFAGISCPPKMRGLSLRSIIRGEQVEAWRNNMLIDYDFTGRVIMTDDYKYIMRYKFSGDVEKPFIRKSDGKSVQFEKGCGNQYERYEGCLLFEIKKDPWETKNLSLLKEYEKVIEAHEKLLWQWENTLDIGNHFDRN